eukprot:CAMPEP_0206454218 /NCGR_PEP_ID=MMETSP0324_2-20121206/21006_1 /ASSEMBLY_ACC=CAM_ASM_000836 /TAXON_ID=2866 /ORGANISM="Crypthecodinium cohnii, Strain Seligo" /LENGTH=308 /DNA_ID=CAMNT_0053924649 /DNA_START=75 /DNA_END=1001 /DNA_ORIENTATION=+
MPMGDDLEPEVREDDDDDKIQAEIEALLNLPFEDALQKCPAIKKYIDEHEDSAELLVEFRDAWSPSAPVELRQVLEELLDPDVAQARKESTEAFLKDPVGAIATMPTPPGAIGFESGLDEGPPLGMPQSSSSSGRPGRPADWEIEDEDVPPGSRADPATRAAALLGDEELARARRKQKGMEDMEDTGLDDDPEAEEAAEATFAKIEELLAVPFEEALKQCPELEQFLTEQEDPDEVRGEFADHWSPEAPEQLRRVLEELLNPAIAAKAKADRDAFNIQMAGYHLEDTGTSQEKSKGADQGPKEPRSKL